MPRGLAGPDGAFQVVQRRGGLPGQHLHPAGRGQQIRRVRGLAAQPAEQPKTEQPKEGGKGDGGDGGPAVAQGQEPAKGEAAQALLALPGGDVILVGYTASKGAGKTDAWIVRLDREGKPVWEKTFGGADHETALDVALLPGGDLMVVGDTRSRGAGDKDGWIARLTGEEAEMEAAREAAEAAAAERQAAEEAGADASSEEE